MPKYQFSCQMCGNLKFERTLKLGEHPTHECPSCKEEAPRILSGSGFGFSFAPGGKDPANSGVHDHDYPSADKIVGRSAQNRWSTYVERDKVKKKVRQAGAPQLIRTDATNYTEYTAMNPQQKKDRENLVDLAVKVGARRKGQ